MWLCNIPSSALSDSTTMVTMTVIPSLVHKDSILLRSNQFYFAFIEVKVMVSTNVSFNSPCNVFFYFTYLFPKDY